MKFLNLFLLEYNCFTMMCQLLLYSKVNQVYVYLYPLFFGFFPFRLLQSIEQNSLCYTVGSHQLSVLYIVVYICYPILPIHSTHPHTPSIHAYILYTYVSISALQGSSLVSFFRIPHISNIIGYLFSFFIYLFIYLFSIHCTLYDSLQVHPHLCK